MPSSSWACLRCEGRRMRYGNSVRWMVRFVPLAVALCFASSFASGDPACCDASKPGACCEAPTRAAQLAPAAAEQGVDSGVTPAVSAFGAPRVEGEVKSVDLFRDG